MKRIGVLSDTHISRAALDLPRVVYKEFEKVDLILHAGDLVEMSVVDKLKKIAETRAVHGNMDMADVKAALPEKDVIRIGGFTIGLIHGYGSPVCLIETVSKKFKKVDAIVFGHSHAAINLVFGGRLLFNPGSPTDKVFASFTSFGIIEVGKKITGRIIRI
ncbi:MAG: metallophosphoesterase family protein [Candidatus Omnitrophota bacterium]